MDNFSFLKLNRAVWVGFIEQENVPEAVKYYEIYCDCLRNCDWDKNSVKEELSFSKELFQQKIVEIGRKFLKDKNYAKAVMAFFAAFKNNNRDIDCIKDYIFCLDELEQYDLSLSLIKYLEEIPDENNEIYKLLAQNYEKREQYPEAIKYMSKYIKLQKDCANSDDYNILGCIYNKYYSEVTHKREDIEKGLKAFEKASDMSPAQRLYAKNATIMASKGNNVKSAKKHWERLFKINRMNNDDKYDYAAFCLKNENFKGWHEYFDARFDKENNATAFPKIDGVRWDGKKDLSKSTLLIYCEQGFGDTFLIWGYISRLVKLVKKIIFVVQDEIVELLENNEFGIEIYSRNNVNLKKINFDYYIPSMSVPIVLKLDRSNISVGQGYIKPSLKLVKQYKNKFFKNDKFKIGISFSGSNNGNKTRNIDVKEFLMLDELKNVQIYNLTKGVSDADFEIFKNNKIINAVNDTRNFADTAAIIANCDVVLTSDNCILNLAGALGVKTFALFNWTYEFRWFDLKGNDVVWYTSVKPYVCEDIDDWKSAIRPALKDIKKLMKK